MEGQIEKAHKDYQKKYKPIEMNIHKAIEKYKPFQIKNA